MSDVQKGGGRIFASAVLRVVVWLATLIVNPFGVGTAADESSRAIYQRVLSPFYPTDRQSDVKVVLLTDDDIPLVQGGREAWPPRFSEYAALLRNLSGDGAAKPKAVFVDLLLDSPHDEDGSSLAELCTAIAALEDRGVKVYFGAVPDRRPDAANRAMLRQCDRPPRFAGVGWTSDEGVYPLTTLINGEPAITAAAALYRDAVAADENATARFEKRIQQGAALSVLWGAAAPSRDPRCLQIGDSVSSKMSASSQIFVSGLDIRESAKARYNQLQKCLFHPTYSARSIARATEFEKVGYADEFADAFVLVGARIDGIPDVLTSPVHGVIPGVYEHAMALDNLLNFGDRFYNEGVRLKVLGANLPVDFFVVAMFVLVLAFIMQGLQDRPRYTNSFAGGFFAFVHKVAIAFALCALVGVSIGVSHFVFRSEPYNWAGVITIGAIMIFTSRLRRRDAAAVNKGGL